MEALTPLQRIAVVAIGLALTLLVAALALPWINKRIEDSLPSTGTPVPWAPTRPPAGLQSPASFPTMQGTSPLATIVRLYPLAQETAHNAEPTVL